MTTPPTLSRLIAALLRRQRLAETGAGLLGVGLPAGLALAAATVLTARGLDLPLALGWIGALPPLVVVLGAQLRRRSPRSAARRADTHLGLDDRLGSALELAALPPPEDPETAAIVALIIAEGEALAATVDARAVVDLRPPLPQGRELAALLGAALALTVAFIIPIPNPEPPAPIPSPTTPATTATPELAAIPAAERALLDPLRDQLQRLQDREDPSATLATAMLEVIDAFHRGELDRQAALAALDALDAELATAEADFEASIDEDPSLLAEGIRALSLALKSEDLTASAGELFARGEGDEAAAALENAAANPAETSALERALKAAEAALGRAASDERETAAALAEEERRLKKKQAADPTSDRDQRDQEEERRLKKKQEERIEALRRQHEREKAAQRALDQLRRDAQAARSQAGDPGQRGAQGEPQGDQGAGAGQSRPLERLSRGAAEATKTAQGARRLGQARDGLEEARQIIRRSGDQGSKGDTRQRQLGRFNQAAKGKKGQGKDKANGPSLLVEGAVGDGPPDLMIEGDGHDSGDPSGESGESSGDKSGDKSGDGAGDRGEGELASAGASDGIGSGSQDPLGAPTSLKGKPRDLRVDPQQGRGATRAEVIATASQEGFASESYRDVFTDYQAFAQSALDREAMPAPQRRRIQRYFRLIQPRR